jgi:molecular chaperone HscB
LPLTSDQDYFSAFGLTRRMSLDPADLEKRFYSLSRKLHPDNFYRASKEEQESSLEQSARLNDAYRTLRDPFARAEYLLTLEGHQVEKKGSGVPPELLEEVFELREWLAELRASASAQTESAHRVEVQQELSSAKTKLGQRLETSLAELQALFLRWDHVLDAGGSPPEREIVLAEIGKVLAKRSYLQNLVNEVSEPLEG